MKKTIKILTEKMNKLQEKKDGTLDGGFVAIKGGFHSAVFSSNESCTNSQDCTHSTNTGLGGCTNTGMCFK